MRPEHLLLVSFRNPLLSDWERKDVHQIEQTPFDGAASAIISAYSTEEIPEYSEYASTIDVIGQDNLDIWPWVFINRLVGGEKRGKGGPFFSGIRGPDLDDQMGTRSDFLSTWRLALRLAREMGSPGIVADFEVYNNKDAYNPAWVAERRNEDLETVLASLRDLGREMAVITGEEYPAAKIWQLFFDPYREKYRTPEGKGLTRTVNYVNPGFLEKILEDDMDVVVIDGGETAIGYYFESIGELEDKIAKQETMARPLMDRFKGAFQLGGTVAPYRDCGELNGWMRDYAGPDPPWRMADDFVPIFERLFEAYRHVWIYAASSAKFDPFEIEKVAPIYNALNQAAQEI